MTGYWSILLKFITKLIVKLRAYALIVYALLLLIHFILKDHFRYLQIIFYAFPLPIIIAIGIFVTLLFYAQPRTYFVFLVFTTLGLTGIWLNNAYIFPRNVDLPENATSILFWNAADGPHLPLDVLIESIKNIQPDIIGLAETKSACTADIDTLSKAFPAYEFKILESDMMIGVKGHIARITYKCEERSYDVHFVEAQLKTGCILVALTDTFQNPNMNKRKTLSTILTLATERDADIIVGDFNTPFESVHFRSYETDYHSFHDYGQGFSATWLFGVPLLEIDQIFIDKKFTPILLRKFNYNVSDHAMLLGYFKK